ncbi:lysylphosphatidylglycerol synthase transmembrane domain-containing protein [Sediminibacterium sp. KACHI17]|jgi:glycosyltransferase 2 family protein|uniref:Lysylphosphatidylglycerol synthase transmembrane domain-containing protein n=1 Tax=Sediminibacterium sp. KACHI17 TaxID=1751071 RepID=A0AAT9GHF6_9BACT
MKKQLLSIGKFALFLGLGLFLVWWSLRQIPDDKWGEFRNSLRNANYWLLIPVFVILIASHLLRALRWKILMEPMGYRPRSLNTFFAVMIGYLANLAFPRLGEVLKCTLLARYEKVPAEKLVGTIVAERAVDVVSLGIVFLLTLVTQYDILAAYGQELIGKLLDKGGSVPMSVLLLIAGIILVGIIVIRVWFKQFAHLKIVIMIKKIIAGVWEGLMSIRHLKRKGIFILYSIGIWFLYTAGTWVGLLATSGTAHLGWGEGLSVLAFGSIGMIVTPGGIGAYAFFIAKLLEEYNIPFELGFANGNLQWFAQFMIVLLAGGLSLLLLPVYNKKNNQHESR